MSCDHVGCLDDAVRSLKWLAQQVQESFGPLGKDVALLHQGQLLVTADGATILDTLVSNQEQKEELEGRGRSRNAIVLFTLNRTKLLVNSAGDGSISLVLFLASAVQHFNFAVRHALLRRRPVENRALRRLALALVRVRGTILPRKLLPAISELAQGFTSKVLVKGLGMKPLDVLLQLLRSHLAGTFPSHVCATIASMVVQWIGLESAKGIENRKADFLDRVYHGARAIEAKLPHCIVQVPGATLLSSSVLRGHYLLRRPVFGKRGRDHLVVRGPCNFCIVLGHSVLSAGDGDGNASGVALPISLLSVGNDEVALAAACRRTHQRRTLEGLVHNGVNLILYEEALDKGVAHELERLGLVAIDLIERKELLHLGELARIAPIGRSELAGVGCEHESIKTLTKRSGYLTEKQEKEENICVVGKAGRARPLTLAGEPFFILEGIVSNPVDADATTLAVPQMLLRAASTSLCSHYYRSLRRCLRVVARWAQPTVEGHCRGLVLPGAAATEVYVSAWLHHYAVQRGAEADPMATALFALSAAALAAPEALIRNARANNDLLSIRRTRSAGKSQSRISGMRISELARLGLSREFQDQINCDPIAAVSYTL